MTKIKKIVAAMTVALTLGAMGTTAFAASSSTEPWGDEFLLYFSVKNGREFSERPAAKYNSYDDEGEVTVQSGAYSLNPVYFTVWDSDDANTGNELSTRARVVANNVTGYMYYPQSGYPKYNDRFYLCGKSANTEMYNSGMWHP